MEKIVNSKGAAEVLRHLVTIPEQEQLFVISLNRLYEVKAAHLCALGGDESVTFCNKIIARHALMDVASAVIIGHNHPSGNPMPSKADLECTEKLHQGLKWLDIELADHIILGDGKYYSFADEKVSEI